jgi:hypothetical protein
MADKCKACGAPMTQTVADLGLSPVSNKFRSPQEARHQGQDFYPLVAMVCDQCWLVQLTEVETAPHFDENYAYFSSFSTSWLEHSRLYAARMIDRLSLGPKSLVVELASNDGYLLQYFKAAGVPVLGVEPSANVAGYAKEKHGIDSVIDFFGVKVAAGLSAKGLRADLIAANNVLAHVPDINDFVGGVAILLAEKGTATFEFPHLLKMLQLGQFDTIYHEHFSYLSLVAVERILDRHGLRVYGVEELTTHGGSLRVYATHAGNPLSDPDLAATCDKVRRDEMADGLTDTARYARFALAPQACKADLLTLLIDISRQGKTICGYGAPAKGNTLLNYCGIGPELLPFTTDMSPHKQGLFLPGRNIPVLPPSAIETAKPDYILILPWNLRDEITRQLAHVREWGAKFVVAIPSVEVF